MLAPSDAKRWNRALYDLLHLQSDNIRLDELVLLDMNQLTPVMVYFLYFLYYLLRSVSWNKFAACDVWENSRVSRCEIDYLLDAHFDFVQKRITVIILPELLRCWARLVWIRKIFFLSRDVFNSFCCMVYERSRYKYSFNFPLLS